MSSTPHSYAAVAARGSPSAMESPTPSQANAGAGQGPTTSQANTKTEDKKTKDSEAPPAYGFQQGTYDVHAYPDIRPYPSNRPSPTPASRGSYSRNGPPPPPPMDNYPNYAIMVYPEPTWLRFVRALAIAAFIYLLASILAESIYLAVKWASGRRHPGHTPGHYDVPPGMTLHQCATSEKWRRVVPSAQSSSKLYEAPTIGAHGPVMFPHAADTSFDLPLDAESLLFLSRGPWLAGDVNVVTSAEQAKDRVSFEVLVRYFKEDVRDEVRACMVERGDGGRGVGIFTPRRRWNREANRSNQVYYETTVILPEGAPLTVKKLETDVPNSAHHITVDGNKTQFEDITLRGSNARIRVDNMFAHHANIRGSNSPVSGFFNVTHELSIETSNAPVKAGVAMHHIHGLNNVPKLDIKTSNGLVDADIQLDEWSPDVLRRGSAPHYEVKATTSNARLDVIFHPDAPSDAVLDFEGTTTNGAASSKLFTSYSGSFEIATSNSAADLRVFCPEVDTSGDPVGVDDSGKCKDRIIRREVSRKEYLKGVMEWILPGKGGKVKKPESAVVVRASNAPAVVSI